MKCDICGSSGEKSKFKTRHNYPHGRKSKGVTTRTCKLCESQNHEENKK